MLELNYRRNRNWFTAMGVLFLVMAGIFIIRDLFIWGPEFVVDFFTSPEITSEKISSGMVGVGCFLIFLGTRREVNEEI